MFNINIMNTIGFIGLGLMGKPMAINLIKAGYSVIVYNRSKPAIDELVSMGASSAKSPKDLAQQVNIIISILPDAPDTKQVLFGKNGVIEGINPNSIFIDMSTISPIQTKLIGSKLLEKHVSMLDAPVSGGDIGALFSEELGEEANLQEEMIQDFEIRFNKESDWKKAGKMVKDYLRTQAPKHAKALLTKTSVIGPDPMMVAVGDTNQKLKPPVNLNKLYNSIRKLPSSNSSATSGADI